MMIRIALIGGSPGSRPKRKTRTSVPTPPQSPSPMPPERTPSAMKPMTTRPCSATRNQSIVLTARRLLPQLLAGARLDGARPRARGRVRTSAICLHAGREHLPIAPTARRQLLDRLLERVGLLLERVLSVLEVVERAARPSLETCSAACLTVRRVRDARVVDSLDHRLGRQQCALETGAHEARCGPAASRLRLLASRRARRDRRCARPSTIASISPRHTPTAPQTLWAHSPGGTVSSGRRASPISAVTTITTSTPATIATIQASAPRIGPLPASRARRRRRRAASRSAPRSGC